LTVLFAPAHVLVDETQGGSEFHWPYKLIERLALDHGVRAIALLQRSCIEHQIPGVQFVSVDPIGTLPRSNAERLRFHLHVYKTARTILASGQPVDVIHHMLPFGFRMTFNFLALCRRRTDPPIVIGPLQPALSFISNDERLFSVEDFSLAESLAPLPPFRRPTRPPLSTFITTPMLSALSSATLQRAAALVATSEQAVRSYRPLIGPKRPVVIPVGVDTAVFKPPSSRNGSGGIDTRPVTILAVGYLIRRKAFDILIRAMGELAKADMPARLRIVGAGAARANLETLVRQLGIERLVTFTGLIPHRSIVSEYLGADIFCSPSWSEGFATVALEALACGLPIVATPTGGFRELLTQRKVGTLVPFGDVEHLASALAQLVVDRSLRETLGRQARALAVQEYDWSVIARRYLSLYQGLRQVRGRAPSPCAD
jgi:glycosyltransferase involved in cell wall biosynthesis